MQVFTVPFTVLFKNFPNSLSSSSSSLDLSLSSDEFSPNLLSGREETKETLQVSFTTHSTFQNEQQPFFTFTPRGPSWSPRHRGSYFSKCCTPWRCLGINDEFDAVNSKRLVITFTFARTYRAKRRKYKGFGPHISRGYSSYGSIFTYIFAVYSMFKVGSPFYQDR